MNLEWIEFILCVFAAALSLLAPRLGAPWFEWLESFFGRLDPKESSGGCVGGASRHCSSSRCTPNSTDTKACRPYELSFLLEGDTFRHARLTNPTHPMWIHFETFHVIQKPSYASQYPSGQGLLLGAGYVLAGDPFWSVWLSMRLFCSVHFSDSASGVLRPGLARSRPEELWAHHCTVPRGAGRATCHCSLN
jgi:hypothetical protein